MNKLFQAIGISVLLFSPLFGQGQNLVQTIRGTILDMDTQIPLAGATIQLPNLKIGTYSDEAGNFKITQVPIGRHLLVISYLGYEQRTISNLQVNSGKEMVLDIGMMESIVETEEVIISAETANNHSVNELSLVSTRTFSVEETKRYAGSIDDPLRMAAAFAGVSGGDSDEYNEIVIRGNAPRMLLWQVEGIEVPSPNHFTEEGTASGAVSILSSNMLSNSDFSTGAFAAEYGNALSGVFDVKLRNGNNQQCEYAAQIGLLGVDFAAEGPFKEGSRASYLVNYRYSTLSLLKDLGIEIVGGEIPIFQDLSFKLNFPTKKAGTFSFFGLGGLSHIDQSYSDDQPNGNSLLWGKDRFDANMGVVGFKHRLLLGSKTLIDTRLSLSGTQNLYTYEELNGENRFEAFDEENFVNVYTKANLTLSHKFNSRHLLKTGVILTHLSYDLLSKEWYEGLGLQPDVDADGSSQVFQAFANWRFRLNDKLTLNSGIHSHYFKLNGQNSIEPRFGLKWQLNPRQYISAGFGVHSRREGLSYYLSKEVQEDGSLVQHNRNLGFTKARHFVLGFDQMLGSSWHMRVEAYYQDLFDVPVQQLVAGDIVSGKISAINFQGNFYPGNLVNSGSGRNYGLELTVEKYFSNNFYLLTTHSLYQSKYTGSDGVEHNTRFNGNFISNVLTGKEWPVGKHKQHVIRAGFRLVYSGGVKYTPIDLEKSIEAGFEIRDFNQAFSASVPNYFRPDVSFAYIINQKRATHFIKLDVQNVVNRYNVKGYFFGGRNNRIENDGTGQIIPVVSYKIQF